MITFLNVIFLHYTYVMYNKKWVFQRQLYSILPKFNKSAMIFVINLSPNTYTFNGLKDK